MATDRPLPCYVVLTVDGSRAECLVGAPADSGLAGRSSPDAFSFVCWMDGWMDGWMDSTTERAMSAQQQQRPSIIDQGSWITIMTCSILLSFPLPIDAFPCRQPLSSRHLTRWCCTSSAYTKPHQTPYHPHPSVKRTYKQPHTVLRCLCFPSRPASFRSPRPHRSIPLLLVVSRYFPTN